MKDRRVAIVGAGIGGLAAAIDLAVAGHRVTVLERQPTPGGKIRQVQAGPTLVDAGPTVFTMRWAFEELFAHAGSNLTDHLFLEPARILARHAWDGVSRLDLHADLAASAEAIGNFAGAREARAFLEFSERAKRIYTTLEAPFLRAPLPTPASLVRGAGALEMMRINPFSTLAGALATHFKDPRLRQLFGRYATYSGSSPYQCPATLMLIAHVEQDGVWLVQGGMIQVALALANLALSLGVTFHYSAHVDRIEVTAGRASAIILEDRTRIETDAVILNADPAALAALRFGPDVARATPAIKPAQRSLSAITLALHARTDGFPLVRHNVFFQPDYESEFQDIFTAHHLPRTPTIYICAQDRMNNPDDDALSSNPERLLVLINAPATGDTKPPTESEIDACTQQAFSHLLRCGLHVHRTRVDGVMTGPAQFNTLFPASGGALYGQAVHGSMATFKRPGSRTKIPNLYLAGGSTHPGAGVPMAALSGRLAAQALISDGPSTSTSRPRATSGGISTR